MTVKKLIGRIERCCSVTGLALAGQDRCGLVRARDNHSIDNPARRDTDAPLPRRYDMSQMTQDMARDRMHQMRRDMEIARGVHGRYAVRQRPRRIA